METKNPRFETLVEIMDRLREPDGCPWDREQTYATLRGYLLEECYEVVEALDRSDHAGLSEELGDLLFQIVFLSRIAKEEGRFDIDDVVRGIASKMIRRHPHVFGSERADTPEEVLRNWEEIKREEKRRQKEVERERSVLDGIPVALPALLKAQRLGTKAARVGFDWSRREDLFDKIEEEIRELRAELTAGRRDGIREELGDLLFTVVNLSRHLEIDAEAALEGSNRKFRDRFVALQQRLKEQGSSFEESGPDELDDLWDELKAAE